MAQEVFFSDIREIIIKNLKECDFDLKIAVAWFTDKQIISVVNTLLLRGVDVTIIIYDDHINKKDLFEKLYYNKAKILLSKKLMHHKFCIIDGITIINGSYNWTNNAKTNDENIQITHNDSVFAEKFKLEFQKISNNCDTIDSYFQYSKTSLNNIENEFEEFYSSWTKYDFPYFLDLRKIKHLKLNSKLNLEKFIYFISNKEEEKKFLWYYFLSNTKLLVSKIFEISGEEIVLPLKFGNVLGLEFNEFNVGVINKSKILIEEIVKNYIDTTKYLFLINNKGKIISDKIEYTGNISKNEFYLIEKIYKTGYSIDFLYFIDSNLIKTKVDFILDKVLIYEKFANFFVVKKYNDNLKKFFFGLIDTNNQIVLPLEFDEYAIDDKNQHKFNIEYHFDSKENKYIDFFEYAILIKSKYSDKVEINSNDGGVRIRIRFCMNTKSVLSILKVDSFGNQVDDTNYLFLRDENYKYSDFYLKMKDYIFQYELISLKNLPYEDKKMKINEFEDLKKYFKNDFELENKYNRLVILRNEKDRVLGLEKESRINSGCYIATMVYKNYDNPNVLLLRNFRDNYLEMTNFGRLFIKYYYRYSPKFVSIAKNNVVLFFISKIVVGFVVMILKINKK